MKIGRILLFICILLMLSCNNILEKEVFHDDGGLSYQNGMILFKEKPFSGKIKLREPLEGSISVKDGKFEGETVLIAGNEEIVFSMKDEKFEGRIEYSYLNEKNKVMHYEAFYTDGYLSEVGEIDAEETSGFSVSISQGGSLNGKYIINGLEFDIVNNEYKAENFGGLFPTKVGTLVYMPQENRIYHEFFYDASLFSASAFGAFAGSENIALLRPERFLQELVLIKIGLLKRRVNNGSTVVRSNNNERAAVQTESTEKSTVQESNEVKSSEMRSQESLDLEELHNLMEEVVTNQNPEALAEYSKAELRILRNMIFAEKGYIFKKGEMQRYFSKKPWYDPYISNQEDIQLNDYEKKFVDELKRYEK